MDRSCRLLLLLLVLTPACQRVTAFDLPPPDGAQSVIILRADPTPLALARDLSGQDEGLAVLLEGPTELLLAYYAVTLDQLGIAGGQLASSSQTDAVPLPETSALFGSRFEGSDGLLPWSPLVEPPTWGATFRFVDTRTQRCPIFDVTAVSFEDDLGALVRGADPPMVGTDDGALFKLEQLQPSPVAFTSSLAISAGYAIVDGSIWLGFADGTLARLDQPFATAARVERPFSIPCRVDEISGSPNGHELFAVTLCGEIAYKPDNQNFVLIPGTAEGPMRPRTRRIAWIRPGEALEVGGRPYVRRVTTSTVVREIVAVPDLGARMTGFVPHPTFGLAVVGTFDLSNRRVVVPDSATSTWRPADFLEISVQDVIDGAQFEAGFVYTGTGGYLGYHDPAFGCLTPVAIGFDLDQFTPLGPRSFLAAGRAHDTVYRLDAR